MAATRRTARLFTRLLSIMEKLRSADGCPWDKRQTHQSLVKYLYAEADEVRQAVRKKDWQNLEEELGDILLQVVFHAQIARENQRFGIDGVIDGISRKLVRRHPHVFGGRRLATPAAVTRQWNEIKQREKAEKKAAAAKRQPAQRAARRTTASRP